MYWIAVHDSTFCSLHFENAKDNHISQLYKRLDSLREDLLTFARINDNN